MPTPISGTYTYGDRDVVPPRCRVPRDVEHTDTLTVTIPETTGEHAPVAMRHQPWDGAPVKEWRWWDGRLWRLHQPWSHQQDHSTVGSRYFPTVQDLTGRTRGRLTRAEALAKVTGHFARFTVIDGIVWEQAGEPRYVVQSFGFGGNHGGTSIGVSTSFNSNLSRWSYFRADDLQACRRAATRQALGRGDTDSVPRIGQSRPIEVLIAEAVRLDLPCGGSARELTSAGAAE